MAVLLVSGVLVGLAVLNMVLAALALWLAGRWWGIVKTSLVRATLVCLTITMVSTLLGVGLFFVGSWLTADAGEFLTVLAHWTGILLAHTVCTLAVAWLIVVAVYRAGAGRAALAVLVMSIPGVSIMPVAAMVAAFVVKLTVMEAFGVLSISFAVRDGQAYVLESEEVVARLSVGDSGDPNSESPLPDDGVALSLFAVDSAATIRRIRLCRDVYYLTVEEAMDARAMPFESSENPIQLGEGEYFFLGDNPPASKDSRFWGVVRADELVGVARCRYWPPERQHTFR